MNSPETQGNLKCKFIMPFSQSRLDTQQLESGKKLCLGECKHEQMIKAAENGTGKWPSKVRKTDLGFPIHTAHSGTPFCVDTDGTCTGFQSKDEDVQKRSA